MDEADAARIEAERTAQLLGYLGLVPFLLLALWLISIAPDHIWRAGTILLLIGYGAVVLSFLGGVRWGIAITRPPTKVRRELTLAIAPALVGWLGFATPVPYAFGVLAVAFAAQGASDTLAAHDGAAPGWYGRLRTVLTVIVVATMIAAFVATG